MSKSAAGSPAAGCVALLLAGAIVWAVCFRSSNDTGDPPPKASYQECERWRSDILAGGEAARQARGPYFEEGCDQRFEWELE